MTTRKLKIAVWHNLPSGGGKRALWHHVAGLVQRGHQVESWCPATADTNYLPLGKLCPEHVLPLAESRRTSVPKFFGWLADYREIKFQIEAMREHCRACAGQIQAGGFDILLANSCAQFAAPPIARFLKIPTIIYLGEPHRRFYEALPEPLWVAPPPGDESQAVAGKQQLLQSALRQQDHRIQMREEIDNAAHFNRILVNSFFSRESVLRAYGLESEVCYLGVDTEHFRPTGEPVENFLMGLGAVHYHKGIDRAIRGVAAIPAAQRPKLLWVGNHVSDANVSALSALAQKLGVEFEIKVMVPEHELVSLLSRATALLYTSRLEPFGLAPLEANACGTPVIAVAEGGVRESLVHGENGWLVADARPETIAAAVQKIFAEPARAAELRVRCRPAVMARWGMADAIARLENSLLAAVGGEPAVLAASFPGGCVTLPEKSVAGISSEKTSPAVPGPQTGMKKAYDEKAADYYESDRTEMLQLLPAQARRVLDVGCGGGAFGAMLKKQFGCEVWGVEANRKACEHAVNRLDHAIHGLFDDQLELPAGHFDCIFFNDVLEHMPDPAMALAVAQRLLSPSGKVVASIPNIAFFPTLWRLAVRGQWEYTERGILDRTHLRFFTRQSIHKMFTDAGFQIEKLDGINAWLHMQPGDGRLWKYYRLLKLLPSRRIREMRFLQFAVVASRPPNP